MTTRNKNLTARFCSAGIGKLAFAMFLTLCIVELGSAQETRIISFDAPGADTTAGDYNGTYPAGVNNWGVITGLDVDADDVLHGFLRSPEGKFVTFEAPGADTTAGSYNGTAPCCINDLGAIAGSYYDTSGVSHAFVRSPDGNFTTFDVPGVGGYGSFPIAMNLEGAVVGYYTDSNFSFHAFLRNADGTFATWIGPDACTGNGNEGCFGSGASNINVFGIVAGGFEDDSGNFVHHSFVRSRDGDLKVFDVPSAGTGGYQGTGCPGCALGLNLWGAVAGTYIDANSVQHGFLRSPEGTFTTFEAPGAGTSAYQGTGCPSDCPTSLNDFGAITGSYIDTNYELHGYLRSPSGKITTVDPAGSVYTWSSDLNDFESITGYYLDANNVYHGFVAVPCNRWCPENDETASRVSSATTINRANPTFNRVFNPRLRLMPWNRSVGVQPSK